MAEEKLVGITGPCHNRMFFPEAHVELVFKDMVVRGRLGDSSMADRLLTEIFQEWLESKAQEQDSEP